MKKGKKIKKRWFILGGFLLVIALLIVAVPKILFTDYEGLPTTGEYQVKQVSAILVDESREEVFEDDGSSREVPVYFYYPETADAQESSFPLVLFSHGAFGYYQSNTSTYMELASHGYVVVSLDHPYHSFFTKDTEGKTITVNPKFMQDVMFINSGDAAEEEIIALGNSWVEIRMGDMNFVIDSVKLAKEQGNQLSEAWFAPDGSVKAELAAVLKMTDTERIGLMGHSLGGAASVTLGRTRKDIDAVIDLDGTMLGEEFGYENGEYQFYEEAYPVPLFSISNEEHDAESREIGELYINNVVLANALDGTYTYFKGSGHMNFTDLPLFSPILASLLGIGEVDAAGCITTMNALILDYYNCYLKGLGEFAAEECY